VTEASACLKYTGAPDPIGIDQNHTGMIRHWNDSVVNSIREMATDICVLSGSTAGHNAYQHEDGTRKSTSDMAALKAGLEVTPDLAVGEATNTFDHDIKTRPDSSGMHSPPSLIPSAPRMHARKEEAHPSTSAAGTYHGNATHNDHQQGGISISGSSGPFNITGS
jgi:hypothetical protein